MSTVLDPVCVACENRCQNWEGRLFTGFGHWSELGDLYCDDCLPKEGIFRSLWCKDTDEPVGYYARPLFCGKCGCLLQSGFTAEGEQFVLKTAATLHRDVIRTNEGARSRFRFTRCSDSVLYDLALDMLQWTNEYASLYSERECPLCSQELGHDRRIPKTGLTPVFCPDEECGWEGEMYLIPDPEEIE